jgi:hypothetical protein
MWSVLTLQAHLVMTTQLAPTENHGVTLTTIADFNHFLAAST